MLSRFRVSNFRSLINIDFRPTGLNLLIGQNNAGKTNLCLALRFVGLSSSSSLEEAALSALGETWNVTNVYLEDRSLEFEVEARLLDAEQYLDFAYSLKLTAERSAATSGSASALFVSEETLRATGGGFQQTSLLENRDGQVRLLHEKRFLSKAASEHYVETTAPTDATMLSRLYDLDTNRRANLFKQFLQSWLYYSLCPYALRSPRVKLHRSLILHDGGNLSKTLFNCHNEKPRTERRIIEALRALEPKLDLLSYKSPDPESVFLFLEDKDGNRFSTQSLSDGTLRFLAMAYLIHACAEARAPKPLVVIEEPENGLYVGHLKPLLQTIDLSGANGQFVFTSHSPYFIDLFEKNLTGVHLLKPGRPSSVLVAPNSAKLSTLLQQMPLGELHFREMIE